ITISIPDAFADLTEATLDPDRNVYTVSMSLDAGSSFDMTVGSSSPGIKIVYAGGPSAQSNDWLTCTPKAATRLTSSSSTYTFTVTDDYKKLFPRATVRVYDVLSGTENILYVDAVAVPQPLTTNQPSKAPNGTSDNPNSFDVANATVTLYRITGSNAQVSFLCPDDMEIVGKPSWIDISDIVKDGTKKTYTLTLNNRDVVLSAATANTRTTEVTDNTVVFANSKNATMLRMPITIVLKDAPLIPNFEVLGGGNNSYTSPTEENLGKISMSVASGNTCTVPVTSMDGATVKFDFGEGNPEWLTSEVTTTGTSSGSKQQNVIFRLVSANLPNAKDVTVTLKNTIGGPDVQFVISPNIGTYSLTKINSTSSADSFSGTNITLYKLGNGTAYMQLKATYWGGSTLTSSNTSALKVETVSSTGNDITYKLTPLSLNSSIKLTLASLVDPSKTNEYSVAIKEFVAPTLNKSSINISSVKNSGGSAAVTVTPPTDGYGYQVKSYDSYYISYSNSGNSYTINTVRPGYASIVFCNKMDDTKTITLSVTITNSINYDGQSVWYYNGYYIAPVDAVNTTWDSYVSSNYYCKNKSGASWRTPTEADMRAILGGVTGVNHASSTAYNYITSNRIFSGCTWTSEAYDSSNAKFLDIEPGFMFVGWIPKSRQYPVRCVYK
ncbi:hypothetical protein, partial [Bacteroides timonensis]|uniref:hypothetical protein n=1 Tax=Bacteroides timonensis TaxID=1470345 RepID=UPI0005C769AC